MEKGKYTQLREAYHDKVYAKTNKLDGVFKNAVEMYRRMYAQYMPTDKNATILDIACGAGQFLKYCLNNKYYNILGVELSRGQVEYVRQNVTDNIMYIDGFKLLEKNPNTYDLIVANDFIEHITKERGIEFVGLVYDALKSGGRIILKTGNMAAFGGLVIWCNGLDHECGYTEKSLRSLLSIWNYQDITIIPYYGRMKKQKMLLDAFFFLQRQLYRYIYAGDYPKVYTKIIAVTGVKN